MSYDPLNVSWFIVHAHSSMDGIRESTLGHVNLQLDALGYGCSIVSSGKAVTNLHKAVGAEVTGKLYEL